MYYYIASLSGHATVISAIVYSLATSPTHAGNGNGFGTGKARIKFLNNNNVLVS